jgi:hypothetical protein
MNQTLINIGIVIFILCFIVFAIIVIKAPVIKMMREDNNNIYKDEANKRN